MNKWTKISLPRIKNLDPNMASFTKELMSVQPMQGPCPPTYTEVIDKSNPRVGVIIDDGDKHPENPPGFLSGCCRERWHKVYTPKGWVCEKDDLKAFEAACKKYGPKYKSLIERERKAWNKAHGLKKEPLMFNMIYIVDSKQKR